jgi:hypothetical protein
MMLKTWLALLCALLISVGAHAKVEMGDAAGNSVFTDLASLGQSLSALNAANTLTLRGQAKACAQVTGTFTATLTWEGNVDNTNWVAVNAAPPTTGVAVASATTTGVWCAEVSALTGFRVRVSAYTSGTAVVSVLASQGPGDIGQRVGISGTAFAALDSANNTAAPANVLVTGVETTAQGTQPTASTGGNVRRAQANLEGALFVNQGGPNRFSCFLEAVTVTTQCQAAPGAGLRAYVTGYVLSDEAATANNLDIVFGTGSNCATGITALTHKHATGTNATTTSPFAISVSLPTPLVPTAANAICVRPSAATAFGATLVGYIAP